MKINELKIGDLIKYKTPDKSNKQIGYFLTTSHIKEIHSNYFIVRGDSLTGSVYCVLFENVISKLEPIKFTPFSMGTCNGQQNCDLCDKTSNFSGGGVCYRYPWRCDKCIKIHGEIKKEYKEIKIEHKSKTPEIEKLKIQNSLYSIGAPQTIKVSNLKIGDKIKFKGNQPNLPEPCECIGTIQKIYSDSFVVENNIHVSEKNIICKLKKIGHWFTNDRIGYKEIPIEKEEKPYWISVVKTVSHPHSVPETTYHCPICDKKLWGLCGMPIKQIANEPCQECKNKEKPAPKSFKYNFYVTSISETSDCDYGIRGLAAEGDAIVINSHQEIKSLPIPNWVELGKAYIIEIKEKE